MAKKNLAVFISGHGSNLNVFLENKDKFQNLFVVSSNQEAYGLVRAKNHQVESLILDKKINWEKLHTELRERKIDLIFLAGFMKIVPASFVKLWEGRIYNLHPSLLPKYKGLNAIKQAYEAQDDIGVSIHHVVPEVDAGEIVDQKIAIKKENLNKISLDEATEQAHKQEHKMVKAWIEEISESIKKE